MQADIGAAEAAQSLGLDLSGALASHTKGAANFFKGAAVSIN